MAKIKSVDADDLLRQLDYLFIYDKATGNLVYKVAQGRRRPGDIAGSLTSTGYREVTVNFISYRAHRLVWPIHYGEWPPFPLDHINCIKDDNRIENLRKADMFLNAQNKPISAQNTNGLKGVTIEGNRFLAKICAHGKRIHLGSFLTAEEARRAYIDAVAKYHGDFGRPS